MARQNLIDLHIGGRGTGKSTDILNLIKAHPKKALIYDTDNNSIYKDIPVIKPEDIARWKSGIYRIVDTDYNKVFELIHEHVWNALVIFEDATKYMQHQVPEVIKQLMLVSKQKNLDLIFTFHSFRNVRPDFYSSANYITKFKTGEDISQFKSKIIGYELVKTMHERVEAHTNRYYKETVHVQ